MKILLRELIEAEPALQALVTTDRVVSAVASYRVARLVKIVSWHLEPFHKERNALLERLGTKEVKPEGEEQAPAAPVSYTLSETNAVEFSTQINALLAMEVEIDQWALSLETLGDYQPSTQHMLALLPLIVED